MMDVKLQIMYDNDVFFLVRCPRLTSVNVDVCVCVKMLTKMAYNQVNETLSDSV